MAIDTNNRVWVEIEDFIQKEIKAASVTLEKRGLDAADTEFERGRIKGLRSILDLAAPSDASPEFDPL